MKKKLITGLASLAIAGLALTGCSSENGSTSNSGDTEGAETVDEQLSIGFFGFAKSNSFALGTFIGIEEAAEELGATATFVDGQFDGQAQVQQVNDAVTSQQYDIIIMQANDNLAVQEPLERAIAAGITVVVEFTPVGPAFDTAEPQIDGAISIVDPQVKNGEKLGEMALMACEDVEGTCQVAYMEGSRALPLDNARTNAVKSVLEGADNIELVSTVEGGYTQDQGRSAFQDITQAHPEIDVVIGSSQAIAGAALAAGAENEIKFIGNGSAQSAVQAVLDGDWFSIYVLDNVANGRKAVELGVAKAQGEDVQVAWLESELAPNNGVGTRDALEESGFVSGYDE